MLELYFWLDVSPVQKVTFSHILSSSEAVRSDLENPDGRKTQGESTIRQGNTVFSPHKPGVVFNGDPQVTSL